MMAGLPKSRDRFVRFGLFLGHRQRSRRKRTGSERERAPSAQGIGGQREIVGIMAARMVPGIEWSVIRQERTGGRYGKMRYTRV
ncbi:MAG: hypothetical protein V1800_15795 [Candidatus Latescibacterota bacterium]